MPRTLDGKEPLGRMLPKRRPWAKSSEQENLEKGGRPVDSCLKTWGLCLPSCEYALPLEWVYTGIKQWLSTGTENRKWVADSVICTPVRHGTAKDTNFFRAPIRSGLQVSLRWRNVRQVLPNGRQNVNSVNHWNWFSVYRLRRPTCVHPNYDI